MFGIITPEVLKTGAGRELISVFSLIRLPDVVLVVDSTKIFIGTA